MSHFPCSRNLCLSDHISSMDNGEEKANAKLESWNLNGIDNLGELCVDERPTDTEINGLTQRKSLVKEEEYTLILR